MENITAGTVAVLVTADGGSEIVQTSVATESGVVLTLSGGETVKLVDNTKTFADVAGSFWGAEAVTFVTSRELFQGTGAATFDPNAPMGPRHDRDRPGPPGWCGHHCRKHLV